MKKLLTLLLLVAVVFTLGGCTKDEKQEIADSYSTLKSADHVFDQVKLAELDEIVAEGGVVFAYFGSPICSACVSAIPYINAFAKNAGIETVYYVEFEYTSTLAQEWYDSGKYDYQGTPLVVTFNNGEFVRSNFTNRSETSSYMDEIIGMFEEFSPNN